MAAVFGTVQVGDGVAVAIQVTLQPRRDQGFQGSLASGLASGDAVQMARVAEGGQSPADTRRQGLIVASNSCGVGYRIVGPSLDQHLGSNGAVVGVVEAKVGRHGHGDLGLRSKAGRRQQGAATPHGKAVRSSLLKSGEALRLCSLLSLAIPAL
jgi:hypothetical protein